MAVLEDALAMASDGQFQVVGVVGEAGVGKSRLCEEFARSLSERGLTVRKTAGVSHAREVPLLPILAFQRDYFGITDADDAVAARRKVSDRLLSLDPGLEDTLPLMFDFLEIPDPDQPVAPMATDVRMRRIVDAIRRVTARRSERETLVLIFEDLHWFDAQSEAFLERLIESYPGSRTLVVANFRPEFTARWTRHSYYRQLPLSPLREEAVTELLSGLLGADLALAPLVSFVLERTGGNPFFVEEVVRALVEDGTLMGGPGSYRLARPVDEIRVPPSVHSVLAARIDRLAADQKSLLQMAAVIGRTFNTAVLSRVTNASGEAFDDALSALCAAELVQESDQAEYRFWHPLTQEVAYGSLLADRRRQLHAAVAEALSDLDPARNDERAALIASHYARAGADLECARWEDRAAAWSQRRDFSDAVERWRNVLAILDRLPESDETLALGVRVRAQLLRTGSRIGLPPEETDRYFAEGQALEQRSPNPALLVLLYIGRGAQQFVLGEIDSAREIYGEARRLAGKTGDKSLVVTAAIGAIYMPYVTAKADAMAYLEEIEAMCAGDFELGARHPGYSPLLGVMRHRGELLALAGRLDEARAVSERTLALAREQAPGEVVAWLLADLARRAELTGESDNDPVGRAEAAVTATEDSGNIFIQVLALHGLGVAELMAGRPGRAGAVLTEALTRARTHRAGLFQEGYLLAHLAAVQLAQGDTARAGASADEAVEVASRQGAPVVECFSLLARSRVRSAGGQRDAAAGDVDAGLALAEDVGVATYAAFLVEERARLRDDRDGLGDSLRRYRLIGATGHARRLEAELAATQVR